MSESPAGSVSATLRGVPGIVVAFAAAGALVAGIAVISYLTGADWTLFKVGNESNVPTWYSSVQLFIIGLVLTPLAVRDATRGRIRSLALYAVPALFFFLSLDEAAMIHERLGEWLRSQGVGSDLQTGAWMVIFVPLVAVIAAVAAWAFWPYIRSYRDVLILGVAGVALFGFSAVGLEVVANFAGEGTREQQLLGFFEEYGEMVAGSLLLWCAVLVTRYEGIRLELGPPRT